MDHGRVDPAGPFLALLDASLHDGGVKRPWTVLRVELPTGVFQLSDFGGEETNLLQIRLEDVVPRPEGGRIGRGSPTLLTAFRIDPSMESPPQTFGQDEISDHSAGYILTGNLHVDAPGDGISLGVVFRNAPLTKEWNEYFIVEE
jgi:hypothetical protein